MYLPFPYSIKNVFTTYLHDNSLVSLVLLQFTCLQLTILGLSTVVSDRANVNFIATLSSVELCSHHIPLFIHVNPYSILCCHFQNSTQEIGNRTTLQINYLYAHTRTQLLKVGLRKPRVRAKFEFIYESSKSKVSFIFFNDNLLTGCSKKNNLCPSIIQSSFTNTSQYTTLIKLRRASTIYTMTTCNPA